MIFSPALPVQLWLASDFTFNEKKVDGINSKCWSYPAECTDEITVQFREETGGEYTIRIVNSDNDTLYEDDFVEVVSGTYQFSFIPENLSPAICDTDIQIKVIDSGNDVVLKTDSIAVRTSHHETVLIEYSNNRNFFGLTYEDVSPALSFFLRVPAVFFHERFPQEDRAMERTSSTIVTSSKLKKQRLMQVLHAPNYFHEKLILALSHHNVTIDGKTWRKEEPYEKEDGDLRYPLKKATVYLTEKNFLARNVL